MEITNGQKRVNQISDDGNDTFSDIDEEELKHCGVDIVQCLMIITIHHHIWIRKQIIY